MLEIFNSVKDLLENPEVKTDSLAAWATTLYETPSGFHHLSCHMASPAAQAFQATLEDTVNGNYHPCLDRANFAGPDGLSVTLDIIESALTEILVLPNWHEVADFTDDAGALEFATALNAIVYICNPDDFGIPFEKSPAYLWVKEARGFNLSEKEMSEHYYSQIGHFSTGALAGAIKTLVEDGDVRRFFRGPDYTLIPKYEQLPPEALLPMLFGQLEESLRVATILDDPLDSPYMNPLPLTSAVVYAEIRKLNPDSLPICFLPPALVEMGMIAGLVSSKHRVELECVPTNEQTLTAFMLYKQGLSLEEAFHSVNKLN